MRLKVAVHGIESEIDAEPEELLSQTVIGCGELGGMFTDFRYRQRGAADVFVSGIQVGLCETPVGVSLSDRGTDVLSEDVLIVRGPGSCSSSSWDHGFRGAFLHFAPEDIERFFGLSLHQVRVTSETVAARERQPMVHLINALASAAHVPSSHGSLFMESVAAAALRVMAILPEREMQTSKGLSLEQASRLRGYIAANFASAISLEDLAAISGTSVGHMLRSFKFTFGLTPYKYILRERVERASDLIRSTPMPLAEIAAKTGFGDQSQLARTFRRLLNLRPSDLR